jgi:hypothetical protein
MHLERIFAHIVAGYLIAVGLLFGLASIFQISYIHIESAGKFYVKVQSEQFNYKPSSLSRLEADSCCTD